MGRQEELTEILRLSVSVVAVQGAPRTSL